MMKYLIPLLFLLTLLGGFLFLKSSGGGERRCVVESREVVRSIYASGYVESKKEVLLRSSVSGYIKELYADVGDKVRRGQLLALIDDAGLESKIRSLSDKIELLQERLKEGSAFRRKLEKEVDIRAENLRKAKERYLRRKRLFERGVIPKEALEEAERLYRNALREYEASLLSLEDTLRGLEKELSSLKEQRKALEKELSRYRIRSPIEGIVLKKFVEKGDYVNPVSRENALFSMGTPDRKVVLQVDEELAPLLKEGQKVYITTDAVHGRVFEGRVEKYDLESERTRRIVEVEVSVQLPESVPVGSVVEGNIVVSRLKTTVVPIEAVKDGFAVLIVNGEKKKVKVNRIFEGFAEVLGYPSGTPCLFKE